jgi:hypothetical protein
MWIFFEKVSTDRNHLFNFLFARFQHQNVQPKATFSAGINTKQLQSSGAKVRSQSYDLGIYNFNAGAVEGKSIFQ